MASSAAAPAIHGQYQPEAAGAALSLACGKAKLSVAVTPGCVAGDGLPVAGVGGAWLADAVGAVCTAGPGAGATVRGVGCGVVRITGREAPVLPGGGALAGGLGGGAKVCVGLGRGEGAGPRTTGFSSSTGPAARGLLVGRLVGSVNTGASCAAAGAGTSGSNSATALAILALPPGTFIVISIISATAAR